jgi:hypothetical protein
MYQVLTLAMTETQPGTGKFHVIGMEMSKRYIFKMELKKEEIITKAGSINWDIGWITEVSSIKKGESNGKNISYTVFGSKISENYMNKMYDLLDTQSKSAADIDNPNVTFSVVKVKHLDNILSSKSGGVFKTYVNVELVGKSKIQRILNKDYRWLNFWLWIDNTPDAQIKKDYYVRLINSSDKTLFLILHKYYFEEDKKVWIVGSHWIKRGNV